MHKKRPKICTCCRVSEAKFYLYHSTKIAKARPGFDDRPEHPSVQINSSSPWCSTLYLVVYNLFHATGALHCCVLCGRYPTYLIPI